MRTWLMLAVLVVPATASATVLWRGDFETGNIKQWTSSAYPRHATIIQTPVRQGKYAARTEVHSEDRWSNGLRRVELVYNPPKNTFQDSEHFYGWSMMQSPDMPLSQAHSNSIAYWESDPLYQVVMSFSVNKDKISFNASLKKPDGKTPGTVFRGDFNPGRWHDFVLHVKWSPDPNLGLIELWYDGVKVVDKLTVQTMHNVNGVIYPSFFKCGILHGDFDADPEAVFIDSAIDATTFDEVGALAVAPDGGAPMPDGSASMPDAAAARADGNVSRAETGGAVEDAGVLSADAGSAAGDGGGSSVPPKKPDASADPNPSLPPDDNPLPAVDSAAASDGCGCRIGERSSGSVGAVLVLALMIAVQRRRRA